MHNITDEITEKPTKQELLEDLEDMIQTWMEGIEMEDLES